jgi:predicted alpha-1,2-mannosidase
MIVRGPRAARLLAAALVLSSCNGPRPPAGDADLADAGDAAVDADVDADADADAPDSSGPDADGPDADAPLPDPEPASPPLVRWVDPFVGTGGLGFGVGSAFPGPQVPFGLARPGPDTTGADSAPGPSHCAGYWYQDVLVRGFSNTRPHGMGIPEYGAVALMPTVGLDASRTDWRGYRSRFSHDTEVARPGYYAVTLDDTDVRVELTATPRVGLHRYTYPAGADAVVLVDLGHRLADMEVLAGRATLDLEAREVRGFHTVQGGYSGRFGGLTMYFVMRFSRAPSGHGSWSAGALAPDGVEAEGPTSGLWLAFDAGVDPVVEVAVGLSFVDEEGAAANLAAEAPEVDFDRAAAEAEAAWEAALGAVTIEGRSARDFTIFYTALYHSLLMPTLASDVDGRYRGLDGEVHEAAGFDYFTDFSLWDTFRTLHPLLVLLYPRWQTDMVRSLVAMGRDGGWVPRWPLATGYTGGMVGDPADIVIADSWVKGVRGFDLAEAYALLRLTAMGPTPDGAPYGGRGGIAEYIDLGFVPIEAAGASASRTLEFAYADFALETLAAALGEAADEAAFDRRSRAYANLWNPDTRFFGGRHADGSFAADDDPHAWRDWWAEGSAWQYLWYAPHDLDGLAALHGGRAALLDRLDAFFEASAAEDYFPLLPSRDYWHGNEPDLHAPWIYAALDRPAAAQRWVRWVLDRHYGTGPDGLPGNDDSGTLSAWYVFASLGFFPIAGLDHYLLASPIFTRAVLHLAGGDLVVEAPTAGDGVLYVREASLAGTPLDRARVRHADLAGATLRFELSTAPTGWATVAE